MYYLKPSNNSAAIFLRLEHGAPRNMEFKKNVLYLMIMAKITVALVDISTSIIGKTDHIKLIWN